MIVERRQRKSYLTKTFSLTENLPAHYRLCIFNILLVLWVFSLAVLFEIVLDNEEYKTLEKGTSSAWFFSLCFQVGAIFMFTLFGILYFFVSQFFPTKACCFNFGTVLIVVALGFFFSTVIWSPWYFIEFLVIHRQYGELWNTVPTLFILMICTFILSIFNIGFVAWVLTHIVSQMVFEKTGVTKKKGDLMEPIKMVNEAKRETEISTQDEDDDQETISTQRSDRRQSSATEKTTSDA